MPTPTPGSFVAGQSTVQYAVTEGNFVPALVQGLNSATPPVLSLFVYSAGLPGYQIDGVAYDATGVAGTYKYDVAASTPGDLAVGGNLTVTGTSNFTGMVTVGEVDATTVHVGGVSPVLLSGDQTVAGNKTFSSKVIAGGTQTTGGIGGTFAPAFGIHFPDSDNTIYHRTGSNNGGAHWFQDLGGTLWARIENTGLHLEDTAGLAITEQFTDSSGSPGDATINKPLGRSAIASGHTTCVVTNSLCTANSVVNVTPEDGLNTTVWYTCVPTSGSFTVTVKTDPGATWKFRWSLIKGA